MSAGCAGACKEILDFDFTMAFQAVVDIAQGRIHAYEALVRGLNGEGASVILGKVTRRNRYAFDQACRRRAIELAVSHGITERLHINFLPNAVHQPEACLKQTLNAANQTGFDPSCITFEFTENERVTDHGHLQAIIKTYETKGFQTALDDFGAGYAGLSLLANLCPSTIKIDRALVMGIDTDPARQGIVEGLLLTCRKLGVSVIAEGVETLGEAQYLASLGIRKYQGFLFAKPSLTPLRSRHIDFHGLDRLV